MPGERQTPGTLPAPGRVLERGREDLAPPAREKSMVNLHDGRRRWMSVLTAAAVSGDGNEPAGDASPLCLARRGCRIGESNAGDRRAPYASTSFALLDSRASRPDSRPLARSLDRSTARAALRLLSSLRRFLFDLVMVASSCASWRHLSIQRPARRLG